MPASALWEFFAKELDRAQKTLAHSDVRICRAVVPSPTCPDVHETGHGAIRVTRGDEFSVLLSTGDTVTA